MMNLKSTLAIIPPLSEKMKVASLLIEIDHIMNSNVKSLNK